MKFRLLLALVVGAVLVVVSATTITSKGDASALDASCGDVTLIWARGSGQGLGATEANKFFQSVRDRLGSGIQSNSYEVGTEEHGGSRYKAVGIGFGSLQSFKNMIEADASWTGGLGGDYRASVAGGVTELRSYVAARATRCEDEVFAIGGYSQGAQVVGDALFGIVPAIRDRIAFVSLFGDPKLHLPEGDGVLPSACRGKGFSSWRRGSVSCWTDNGVLEARVPYLPSDLEDRTGSWCDRNDGICNNNTADLVAKPDHGEYAAEGAEMDEAAREIAEGLADQMPGKESDIDVSIRIFNVGTAGLDVAFVIDTTGSMAGTIGAARSIASTVGGGITALRGRVALTEYRDYGDPVVSQIVTPLTTDIDSFRAGLDTLYASGGGDAPEALLHAMMTTLNGLDWKPGATKAAVVLTDIGYHDPDVASGYTLADVVARSLEIDPVNVYPVVPGYAAGEYAQLATGTAGQVLVDEGDTAAALLDAVDEIETRPVVLLASSEYIAKPGEEIVFDASPSYDPDSELEKFEWDFDGDSVIDAVTTEPSAAHTYVDAYEGLVEVRVLSEDGGIANGVASVRVDAEGLAGTILEAPANLTAATVGQTAGDRLVRLAWSLPPGGAPVGSWVVRNGAGEKIATRPAAARAIEIGGVPLAATSFQVAAVNEFGTGAFATVTAGSVTPPPPPGAGSGAAAAGVPVQAEARKRVKCKRGKRKVRKAGKVRCVKKKTKKRAGKAKGRA